MAIKVGQGIIRHIGKLREEADGAGQEGRGRPLRGRSFGRLNPEAVGTSTTKRASRNFFAIRSQKDQSTNAGNFQSATKNTNGTTSLMKKRGGIYGQATGAMRQPAQPTLAVLLLMAILAQALFTLVRCDLVPFPFFSARHVIEFNVSKNDQYSMAEIEGRYSALRSQLLSVWQRLRQKSARPALPVSRLACASKHQAFRLSGLSSTTRSNRSIARAHCPVCTAKRPS